MVFHRSTFAGPADLTWIVLPSSFGNSVHLMIWYTHQVQIIAVGLTLQQDVVCMQLPVCTVLSRKHYQLEVHFKSEDGQSVCQCPSSMLSFGCGCGLHQLHSHN